MSIVKAAGCLIIRQGCIAGCLHQRCPDPTELLSLAQPWGAKPTPPHLAGLLLILAHEFLDREVQGAREGKRLAGGNAAAIHL